MKNEQLLQAILEKVGGRRNVLSVENCMTRLRLRLSNGAKVDDAGLRSLEGVLGIVHDEENYIEVVVGPGVCRQLSELYKEKHGGALHTENDWKANKEAVKASQKDGQLKGLFKTFGKIFIPLIPGVIAAGLCAGFATLLAQMVPDYEASPVWSTVYQLLSLINISFMTYLTAWSGYRAAEEFGATPLFGGMLGMITSLEGINIIAQNIGLYNTESPLDSILRVGRGGVLAAVIGVFVLSKVEKAVRKRIPGSLDIVVTPILTLFITAIPYILLVMPLTGLLSNAICWAV